MKLDTEMKAPQVMDTKRIPRQKDKSYNLRNGVTFYLAKGAIIKASENGETKEHTSKRGNYEGPDHDLAAMLKRDVLEDTTNVKFDDAGSL
uniref:Katanin p60 ATPase-containing subunit A1 n=1 Tax=Tanacetum cinerariifolium TaxID=118510 RepID=A0A6L2LPE1_TANCI|nr:katanin p60 ATPase-containing subunit A1 [Tanacetum cinerariifolium]